MKTFITSLFVCVMMIFSAAQVNAQGVFQVCGETTIFIDNDRSVTVYPGEDVKIFKVWSSQSPVPFVEFNEYTGGEVPSKIESVAANGTTPIVVPCTGNFWLDIQTETGNCTFNLSENVQDICTTGQSPIDVFDICCGTTIVIDENGFVTAFPGEEVDIFKVWNGGWKLAEFNEYNGDDVPLVIQSVGPPPNSAPINVPCGSNFWISVQCEDGYCPFNASQNRRCKTGENLDAKTVSIYPNPAIDFINIELPFGEEAYTINVLDLSGRVVETIASNGGQTMLATENLNTGLYIVNVEGETKTYTQKVQIIK